MKVRIAIDDTKIKNFLSFCGEFIDVVCNKDLMLMCSETGDFYAQAKFDIMSFEGEDTICVRMPSSIISKLRTERIFEIVINEETINCLFYDKKAEYQYSIEMPKQVGFIDYAYYLDLSDRRFDFDHYDMTKIAPIVNTLASLNTDIMCLENIVYGEAFRSFIFNKAELPNFRIPAKILKKLITGCNKLYFIERYIYGKYQDIDVYLYKHRVPDTCDLTSVLRFASRGKVEIDTSNLIVLRNKINIDDKSVVKLNLAEGKTLITDGTKNIVINTKVLNVESPYKKEAVKVDTDQLLESLASGTSSSLNLDEELNPHNLPELTIPRWAVNQVINQTKTKIVLSDNFIIMSVYGGKVLLPRR